MMMTGFSLEQLITQAIENGALGVLRKPFAIQDLLHVLDQVKPRGMVLVADDDPDFSASLEPILMQNGYRVVTASTGEEALAKASVDGVNCLVLDLSMPLLTGIDVYRKLKAAGKDVPTIFVTGLPGERANAVSELRSDGGVLMKPFNPSDLLRAIENATAPAVGKNAA
jgi:DNA-binding response OmpR family regulator